MSCRGTNSSVLDGVNSSHSRARYWSGRAPPAQRSGKIPRVGVLWHAGSVEEEGPYYGALLEGLNNLGYVEGRNIELVHRFPNETPELFTRMTP
jgi:putative tryptophan/tyrosine transport system substrate-binding protein